MKTVFNYLLIAMVAAAYLTQSAGAFAWVLNGSITDASTCHLITGANVTSPYNGHFFNISNSRGIYNLPLGIGNWSVTVSAHGYNNGSYLTPYESSGVLDHNFSLIPVGGSARSPPCFSNTTIITNTSTTITPGTQQNTTTTPPTTTTGNSGSSPPISSSAILAGVVIVIVIVAIVLAMRWKKAPKHKQ